MKPMKRAEVLVQCFALSFLFLAGVFGVVGYITTKDNYVARAEHPTLYLAQAVVTALCIGYFVFYSFYVWRGIGKGD